MFNIVHVHVHVYYAYTVHVLDFSCTMYMYVESTVASGFHLGDGGAWELILHSLNYSTIDNKKLLHNKTKQMLKILSKRQSFYPFCSSLAIPYSDKPEFCHPLSHCLNETLGMICNYACMLPNTCILCRSNYKKNPKINTH